MPKRPDVRTLAETKTHFSQVVREVNQPGAHPVFVGSHRKPQAVIMSAAEYETLTASSDAARQAIAIARLQGYQPTADQVQLLNDLDDGSISLEEAEARVLAKYRRD